MTNKDSDYTLPNFFTESIRKDVEGIASLLKDGPDPLNVKEFLEVLDKCEGQVLVSGIGKQIWWHCVLELALTV